MWSVLYVCTMSKKMQIVVVGPFEVNCYLYWDTETQDGVVIDPGDDGKAIIKAVRKCGLTPKGILLTHGHGDHIAAVADVKSEFGVPVFVGKGEEKLLTSPSVNMSAMTGYSVTAPAPDRLLADEESVLCGSIHLIALATPGHTPAGMCYLEEEQGILFCGDTLFQGSVGRTDFPGSSTELLLDSIQRKILTLPDGVVCFPGHGPRTTVGAERRSNPFLIGESFA